MLTHSLCLCILNAIFSRGAVLEAISESPAEAPPLFPLDGHWGLFFVKTAEDYLQTEKQIGMIIKPLDKHLQFSVYMWMTNFMTLTMDCEAGEDAYACKTTPMTTTHAMDYPHQMRDEALFARFFNLEPQKIVITKFGRRNIIFAKGDVRLTFYRRDYPSQLAYPFKGSWGITKSSEGESEGVAVQIDTHIETAINNFHFSMNMTIANSMNVNAECRKPVPLDLAVAYTCNKLSFRSIGVMGSPEDMEKERRFETLFGKMQGKDITLSSDPHNIDMIRLTGDDASLTLNRAPLRPGEALLGDWVISHAYSSRTDYLVGLNSLVSVVIQPLDKQPLDKRLHFSVHIKVASLMTLNMDCDPQAPDPKGHVLYACKTTPMTTTDAKGSAGQMRDEAVLAKFFNQEPYEVLFSPNYRYGFEYNIYKGGSSRNSLVLVRPEDL